MTKSSLVSLVFSLCFCLVYCQATAQTYPHSLSVQNMEFHWKIDGKNLAVKVSAKTEGWVGVGFNPERNMKGADFIIGYVDRRKVVISDQYGNRPTGHVSDDTAGGVNSVVTVGGSEKRGVTTLEFTIPLNSTDQMDSVLDPKGKTLLLLAYGVKDSFQYGHRFRTTVEVNLGNGDFKEVSQP